MFYADSHGSTQWLVSLKTGKRYYFRGAVQGEDWVRAGKEIERDDTPKPKPEPEPVKIVQLRPRPIDPNALMRITADEMKLRNK